VKYKIREFKEGDQQAIIDIFNYFIRESFAAYKEQEVKPDFFNELKKTSKVFYVLEADKKIVGFGFIKPYLEYENFSHTGGLTYFIMPQYTDKGLGTQMLSQLIDAARGKKITHLLAHISSRNHQSLRFHQKHGFKECGRLEGIGKKFDEPFDVVWMQKIIDLE
jgi:phosphinothricin acetyltransferase